MRDAMREGFAGIVIIEDRDSAFAYASQEYNSHEEKSHLAFWVDRSVPFRSRNGSPGAAGVVCKSDCRTSKWIEKGYPLGRGGIKSGGVEVLAIAEALQIAQEKITSGSITRVMVYSDPQAALIRIRDFRSGNRFQGGPMIRKVIAQTKVRQLGAQVILCWVPGHAQVPGNMRPDSVTKGTTTKSEIKQQAIMKMAYPWND